VFGPYIVYAYRDFYGAELINPADVYLPNWLPDFDGALVSMCVDDILIHYSHSARRMYLPEFRQVLYDGRLAQEFPRFAQRLAENATGLSGGADIPVLILQGTADTVITPPSQREYMEQLCALGNSVTWLEYEAVAHVAIRWNSFDGVLAWMANVVEGGEPRSDC
jgi:pimeloyl-ACP methyl ester carboxylesterase